MKHFSIGYLILPIAFLTMRSLLQYHSKLKLILFSMIENGNNLPFFPNTCTVEIITPSSPFSNTYELMVMY